MLLSSLGLRLHKPQLFRSKRPVDRALGFYHSLGSDGSLAPYGNACVERDRPFPHVPSNALNDAIVNAAILHVVKTRSPQRRLAMRRTLCGVMSAPTGPFSEYAPQAAGIKRLPAYHLPALRIRFPGGRYFASPTREHAPAPDARRADRRGRGRREYAVTEALVDRIINRTSVNEAASIRTSAGHFAGASTSAGESSNVQAETHCQVERGRQDRLETLAAERQHPRLVIARQSVASENNS
jgi:hypothetical protein